MVLTKSSLFKDEEIEIQSVRHFPRSFSKF